MKMNSRMILRIVVVVIAVAIFGWQWWGKHHVQNGPANADVPASGASTSAPAAPIKPAPPATLKVGSLTLAACELKQLNSSATTPAFCAKFPVPENRADPESRKIDLKLAMLKHHDVLLLDQRGTGGSNPLECPIVEKEMKQLGDTQLTPAQRAEQVGKCASEVEKDSDPRYYTTTDAVADLDAVREALGVSRLNLIGVSYGTRVAQHFAAAHPAAVRSIVLDGVVPNQMVVGETLAEALEHC